MAKQLAALAGRGVEPPAMTILTGATGWLGRSLVRAFLDEEGPHVRAGSIRVLVCPDTPTGSIDDKVLTNPRVEVVSGDVRAIAGVRELFAEVPATTDVIHTAGVIHPRTPSDSTSEFVEVNARGTRNVAAAARRAGVRRLVHVSSNSPFGVNPHRDDRFRNDEPYDPYLGYGRSKMLAELRLLDEVDAGLDAVIVRPPWFYGPNQPARQTRFFTMVRRGRFPLPGDGTQRRSMVYVDNLVQGIALAELVPTPPGRGWWIADEEPYELRDIVATVKAAMADAGLPVSAGQLRVPLAAARVAESADRLLQRRRRYNQQLHVLGELGHTIACDISVARAELGYQPEVGLAEGMRRSVQWCLDNRIEL